MVAKLIIKNNDTLVYEKIKYIREDSTYKKKTIIALPKNKSNKKMCKTSIKKI